MPTKERIEKVKKVLNNRLPDLRVVLEEVTNTHNASAVARTCDAAGILYVDIIYKEDRAFPINEAISTRAEKWLHFTQYQSTAECLSKLKAKGYYIAATHLGKSTLPYDKVDFTRPTAIVFGNESEGISKEALKFADAVINIPMAGMAHSLNLSVGIILYEALRQRSKIGADKKNGLSSEEFDLFMKKWLYKNEEY